VEEKTVFREDAIVRFEMALDTILLKYNRRWRV